AQIREILISESAWEEMTCLFAPSLTHAITYCPVGIVEMRDSSHQYVVFHEKCRVKYRNRTFKNQAITHPEKGENARRLFHPHEDRIHACLCLQVVIYNAHLFLSGWRTKTL
ncbi:hypothetical protein ACLHXY_26245, partial [Klebsiella quasipneumoniae]|uniref:hypothetical protein n=1 Tax=Klebsiella quasipneumoniae TaxID=1463165 RepID=UPI003982DE4C